MPATGGILTAASREVKRMLRTPVYSLLLAVLPLVSCALMSSAFQSGVPRDLPVAVWDGDNSPLSRRLVRMVDATPSITVAWQVASPEDGEALVRQGRAYAVLVIDRDLERDVRRGTSPRVVLLYNAQMLLPANLIRRDTRAAVSTLAGGLEIRMRQARGEPDGAAFTRLDPIRLDTHVLANPALDYSVFLLNGVLPSLLQIFIVVAAVHAIGVELKDGTARDWLASAGGSAWRAALGKLLPYTAWFVALGFAMLAFLWGRVGVPMRGNVLIVLFATVLFVVAYEAVALLIVAATANLRFATSVAAFYAAPAFAFAGITFPVASMPAAARAWSALLPLTHYLRVLVVSAAGGGTGSAVRPMAMLAAFVVTAPALASWRLERVMSEPRFWGRA